MKRLARFLTALALSAGLLLPAGLAAFLPVREEVEFSDVPTGHWAWYDVSRCYRYGLLSGTDRPGIFSPSGTLSVAEAIIVTLRVRDLYQGGDGVIDQGGATWYDGAVSLALEQGLLSPGQFDSYLRPTTRAELAGLLAAALPESEYKAINSIASLPDVDASTPHSQAIFRLYNAGILTGSDGFGSFHPDQNITRAELAAILCRLVFPHSRKEFTLLPAPKDLTVYSTGKRLLVDGFPVYGLTRIDGKYYLPVALLENDSTAAAYLIRCSSEDGRSFSVRPLRHPQGNIPLLDYWAVPPEGKVMGAADPEPGAMEITYGSHIQGAVYTLNGGYYPMLSLEAMGAVPQGDDLVLNLGQEQSYTPVPENDLAGGPIKLVRRDTDRETVIAIHDYLVNLLTYDITVNAPRGTTDAEYAAAEQVIRDSQERYLLSTNAALDSKYAICQDYADLFQNMCIRCGIPCIEVTGEAGGPHAWNKVYVDGQWLYMDCTWDDPVSRTPTLRHDYCLVGPDTLVKDHYWDGEDYPMPKEYDPAWEQLDPNNITSADMFRKCLVAQVYLGKNPVVLRVTKSGAYGGVSCLYAYSEAISWWRFYGGYDKSLGAYVYHFE